MNKHTLKASLSSPPPKHTHTHTHTHYTIIGTLQYTSFPTYEFTHLKLHSVRVGKFESFCFVNLVCVGEAEWFGFRRAGELAAAGQLNLSSHYPPISELILFTALVVGEDEVDMIEDVRGSVLT